MKNRSLRLPPLSRTASEGVTISVHPSDAGCQAQRAGCHVTPRKPLTERLEPPCAAAGMSVAAEPGVQTTLVAAQSESFRRWQRGMQAAESRMILVVGADVPLIEWAALSLFRAGHLPLLGQWYSPLVTGDTASATCGDDLVGDRLLSRCDAVLRVEGPAPDADALVRSARARGLRVYDNLEDAIAG
jgi:hypothetical protein